MNSYSEKGSGLMGAVGANGPAGPMSAAEARTTPLNRLENALNRLHNVADGTVGAAMSLTGGWPQATEKTADRPQRAGMFGAIEDIADAIHRVSDCLDEANRAVVERLP